MPTILQDVVDYTFSFLADSPHELSTCALVCRDWLPGSHSVLFSSITLPIRTGRASDRWIPLEAILEKNPSLAIYVRSLTLKGDHEDITHVKWRGYRTFELHWLPNLRSLTLDRFWFTNIDHVHSIIASAPLLDNLVLDHIQWVSPPHEGPRVPRPQICLQDSSAIANAPRYTHSLKQFSFTADVYVTHRSFHDPILRLGHSLLSAGMIHALQSLELYGASQCESWEPVLRIIGPSLHHLGIGIYEDKEDDLDPSKTVAEQQQVRRIYDGLRPCSNLHSFTNELRAYVSAHKAADHIYFQENQHNPAAGFATAPCVSPFFLVTLRDLLDAPSPGSGPFPALEHLTLRLHLLVYNLRSCAEASTQLAEVLLGEDGDERYYPSFVKLSVHVEEERLRMFESGYRSGEPTIQEKEDAVRRLFGRFGDAGLPVEVRVWKEAVSG